MVSPDTLSFLKELKEQVLLTVNNFGLNDEPGLSVIDISIAEVMGFDSALLASPEQGLFVGTTAVVLFLLALSPAILVTLWAFFVSFAHKGEEVVPAFSIDLQAILACMMFLPPLLLKGVWVYVVTVLIFIVFKLSPAQIEVPAFIFQPYLVMCCSVAIGGFLLYEKVLVYNKVGFFLIGPNFPIFLFIAATPIGVLVLWALIYLFSEEEVELTSPFELDLSSTFVNMLVLAPLLTQGFWPYLIACILLVLINFAPNKVQVPSLTFKPYLAGILLAAMVGGLFFFIAKKFGTTGMVITCTPLTFFCVLWISIALILLWLTVFPFSKERLVLVPEFELDLGRTIATMVFLTPFALKGVKALILMGLLFGVLLKAPSHIKTPLIDLGPSLRPYTSTSALIIVLAILILGITREPVTTSMVVGEGSFTLLFLAFASVLLVALWAYNCPISEHGVMEPQTVVVPPLKFSLSSALITTMVVTPLLAKGFWALIILVIALAALSTLPEEISTRKAEFKPQALFSLLGFALVLLLSNGAKALWVSTQHLAWLKLINVCVLLSVLCFMLFVTYKSLITKTKIIEIPSIHVDVASLTVTMLCISVLFAKGPWLALFMVVFPVALFVLPTDVTIPPFRFKSYLVTLLLVVAIPFSFNGAKTAVWGVLALGCLGILALYELGGYTKGLDENSLKRDFSILSTDLLGGKSSLWLVSLDFAPLFPLVDWSIKLRALADRLGSRISPDLVTKLALYQRFYRKKTSRKFLRGLLVLWGALKEVGRKLALVCFKPSSVLGKFLAQKFLKILMGLIELAGLRAPLSLLINTLSPVKRRVGAIWIKLSDATKAAIEDSQSKDTPFNLDSPDTKLSNLASDVETFASKGSNLFVFMFLVWSFFSRVLLVIAFLCIL